MTLAASLVALGRIHLKAVGCFAFALLLVSPAMLHGQDAWGGGGGTLAQADALYAAGDLERAEAAYEQVLQRDPENSRAMFQLARLLDDDASRAIRLLRGYVAAEPDDPWGYWALGEALARAGDLEDASDALATAREQAPEERDFVFARAEVLSSAGRHGQAAEEYEGWVRGHPRDAEALRAQGEQLRRARRPRAAAAALEASLQIEPDEGVEERLEGLRAESAPSVEPGVRITRDSDGNSTVLARFDADVSVADGLRIGVSGTQQRGRDALYTATSWQGLVGLEWSASQGSGVELYAGAAGLPTRGAEPLLRVRGAWRPTRGPAADVRFQHTPVTSTPQLLASPVILSEARGSVDLPIAGPLYLRGLARAGRLEAASEVNSRTGYGGGVLLRGGAGELGGHYQRTRYEEPASTGYFAPRQIESLELAGYTEIYRAWPLTFVLDGGVGGERITDWDAAPGSPGPPGSPGSPGPPGSQGTEPARGWKPAIRLWSMVSWTLRPGWELRLEMDAYESHAGEALAPTAAGWRWGSLGLSLQTALR